MEARIITTDYEKGLFWSEIQESEIRGTTEVDPMHLINVYPNRTYQEVKGFGGAFTEAGGYTLSLLSEETRREVMNAYFSKDGLCYNLCRTHINSCDFSLGNYDYIKDGTDKTLTSFTVEHDRKYLIPMILLAKEISSQEITLLASPWSPPGFMKTNGEMNHGGHLKKEYYGMWAEYLIRYIKEYEKAGITISMLTVQNEPQATQTWDSCIYSSEEEQAFVKDYLGPRLEENGLESIKVLIWDHNKELLYERAKEVLSDSAANRYIDGIGFHWYTGDHFDAIRLVREEFPEKELYFTEGCVEYSRFQDSSMVKKAEMYAHDMIGNFAAGMNGYMDWNMVLDETGGPNHVGNYCYSPIMIDTKQGRLNKQLSYYYIGHLSKFVKRGARKVATTKYTAALDVVGFVNPDGERVIIILNQSNEEYPVSLKEYFDKEEIRGIRLVSGSHSIVTVCLR